MTNIRLIKLYSKNQQSLRHFIKLLEKSDSKWKNLTFVIKTIKKKRNRITVLKSPHVNKKAQTQFQSITYSTLIKYSSWEIKKSNILLKKIRNHLFPDVKIKIEQTIFTKKAKMFIKKQLSPKKCYYYTSTKAFLEKQNNNLLVFNGKTRNKRVLLEKTLQSLKILDRYGSF